jgi:hypothetical protein
MGRGTALYWLLVAWLFGASAFFAARVAQMKAGGQEKAIAGGEEPDGAGDGTAP